MRLNPLPSLTVVVAVLGPVFAAAQTLPEFHFQFTESPGPYFVGFKIVQQYDPSRAFHATSDAPATPSAESRRPLQTLVWYPAVATVFPRMSVGDYAALIHTETSFDKPVDQGKPQSFVEDFARGTTSLPTWAIRDAAVEPGRYPLLLYAPSLNSPAFENIELCEYLASHGFVVVATPSMGALTRTMTVDIAGANAEAQDISFLIDFAGKLPQVDISKIAVIGYSWGAMAALFASARDSRIGALVSLDGSFRYAPETVLEAGDVHPDQMKIPLLVFSRAEETLESRDAQRQSKRADGIAPNVLNEWTHGDLLHVHMLAVSHIQFSSLYQRSERFRKEGLHFVPADYSLEDGAASYNWMAHYTLEFLDAYLKHDVSAGAFLRRTPSENDVPKHLIAATLRPAAANPTPTNPPPAQ